MAKQFVLGVDIGGQSFKCELFEVSGNKLSANAVFKKDFPSPPGVATNAAKIKEIIDTIGTYAKKQGGTLVAAGLGSPGRFKNDVIAPGSATQLGSRPDEFDGVNLKQLYKEALAGSDYKDLPLYLCNDGDAMLAGMLEAIKGTSEHDKNQLKDQNGFELKRTGLPRKQIALFGIGSGIGHAIVQVKDDGSYNFVTDGHASKLCMKVDKEDLKDLYAANEIIKRKDPKLAIVALPNDESVVRAEDTFKAPMNNALAELFGNGDEKAGMDKALRFSAKYMARTIELIHSGQNEDTEPQNGWNDDDKKVAAKTNVYLIGGALGRSADGAKLIEYAGDELKEKGIYDIQLVQVCAENVATRAAANLVPASVYQQGRVRQ